MSSTQTGAVTFVSAGPGDPGLLTRRALDALGGTEQIFYDASMPQDLLAAVTEAAPGGISATAVEGSSADIAQTVVTAARSGSRIARVVHG
ncbi:MAG: SAM-dependent methyltransferase, partial [Mycobacteriales bacterium]